MADQSSILFDQIYDCFPERSANLPKLNKVVEYDALRVSDWFSEFFALKENIPLLQGKLIRSLSTKVDIELSKLAINSTKDTPEDYMLDPIIAALGSSLFWLDLGIYLCNDLLEKEPERVLNSTQIHIISVGISLAAICNNPDLVKYLTRKVFFMSQNNLLSNIPYATQFLILKMACDFIGIKNIDWPESSSSQPLLNEIYQHWDTEDLTLIQNLLIKLCNYHTYQTRNVNDEIKDITQYWQYHFPYEILFILRLRQWKGLQLPKLDHPLMESPFDQLPEKIDITPDPLIDQVREKFIELFPDFPDAMDSVDQEVTSMLATSNESTTSQATTISKEDALIKWLNKQPELMGNADKGTLSFVSNLLLPHEADELLRILAMGQQSKHVFKNTPYEKFMRVWDADNPLIPSSFISDWSNARSWALDLYEKSDSLFKFICQRADTLEKTDDLDAKALFKQLDDIKPWDFSEFHEYCDELLKRSNNILQAADLKVVQLEMGRSEYTVFLVTLDKAEQLPKATLIDGIEIQIE